MLKRFLDYLRGRPKDPAPRIAQLKVDHTTGIAKVDKTNWDNDAVESFQAAALQHAQLPLFVGDIENGYALSAVATSEQCPQCDAATQQQYASFIYATNLAARAMFAPAGYFCSRCPTVIVDEEVIRSGIVGKFKYEGVIGIDYDNKKPPETFRTWNGKPTVLLMDEETGWLNLTTDIPNTHHHPPNSHATKNSHTTKNRRRQEKESRRRNRPKK